MTLYFIGLGLGNEKDITLKGLETAKKCSELYLENYTSVLDCSIKSLEELFKKKILLADRELIEKNADVILDKAKNKDIGFLVVGDPFGATTHIDLMLRAEEKKVKVKVVHNASIITAVGVVGLELYKYGKITSIPFENEHIKTPYNVLKQNLKNGLHTLFLLDLNPKEKQFMTVNDAIRYLLREGMENRLVVGCAGIGYEKQVIKVGKAKDLLKEKFTVIPQCLIVPGKLHFMEEDALKMRCR